MVAGLEDITEGEFKIDGKIMNDVAPKDRDIAMVFQNYALYPHMTVFDNMAFGLKLRKFKKMKLNVVLKKLEQFLVFLICLTVNLLTYQVVNVNGSNGTCDCP